MNIKQISKDILYNNLVVKEYNRYWIKLTLKIILGVGLYLSIFPFVHFVASPITFSAVLFCNILFFLAPVSISLFVIWGHKRFYLNDNNTKYCSWVGILLGAICHMIALLPITLIIYYFGYDFATDTQKYSIWEILSWTPIVFFGVLFLGIVMGSNSQLFFKQNVNSGYSSGRLSRSELFFLKQDLDFVGIDPNKIILVGYENELKSMSRSDWFFLKQDLELIGYNISKK